MKRPVFLHTCVNISELPFIISNMVARYILLSNTKYLQLMDRIHIPLVGKNFRIHALKVVIPIVISTKCFYSNTSCTSH